MKYHMLSIVALTLLTVSGCAQSPGSILPQYVSDATYRQLTCEQLADERSQIGTALVTASAQQEQARSNDVAGVIFVGLPLGSMSGQNVAPMLALYKGQKIAIERQWRAKECDRT